MDRSDLKRSSSDVGLESPSRYDRGSSVLDARPPPPRVSKARACEYLPRLSERLAATMVEILSTAQVELRADLGTCRCGVQTT